MTFVTRRVKKFGCWFWSFESEELEKDKLIQHLKSKGYIPVSDVRCELSEACQGFTMWVRAIYVGKKKAHDKELEASFKRTFINGLKGINKIRYRV
jgi:hypothetical protein